MRIPQFLLAALTVAGLPLVASSAEARRSGGISQFPVPTPNAFLFDITPGPDGNVWFTEFGASKVGRMNTGGSDVMEFATPTPFAGPQGITAGPDGNLWFTESSAHKIGRITPAGAITEFATPTPGSGPTEITAGPDGNMWLTETNANHIGRITPAGAVTEFALPTPGSRPHGITAGPDGALWFTETASNRVGRISTAGLITEFPLPTPGSQPRNIVAGPDGNLWFTMRGGATIGRITPAGAVTEFLLPSRSLAANIDFAYDITVGSDGALWYSRPQANVVGRIDTAGVIGESVLPTPRAFPTGITFGPDRRVWIVLEGVNRIGALSSSPLPLSPPEVRSVSPNSGLGAGGIEVVLTGVNLSDASAVVFGETPAGFSADPVDAGKLIAISPPHVVGVVQVVVTTPRGASGVSDASRFFYVHPACGRVITASSTLRTDIGPCLDDGLVIGADNITVDLNGRRIFGFPGPGDGTSAGIQLTNRTGVVVRNGIVSDFDAGVFIDGGRRNAILMMGIRDNLGPDNVFTAELGDGIVLFNSAENRLQGNVLSRNGVFDGIGVLGTGSDGNLIIANTVEDTVGPSDRGPAGQGIIVNAFLDLPATGVPISRNHVLHNVVRRSASSGISNVNNVDGRIESNVIEQNGLANEHGNGIAVQRGPFALAHEMKAFVQGNLVRGNGEHGISIVSSGNRIIGNTSVDNSVKALGQFRDLFDENSDCLENTWYGNTWGTAGISPPCVGAGGNGPTMTRATARQGGSTGTAGPIVRRSPRVV